MSLKAIGMGLNVLVDILIAARLGTTGVTDALVIALSVPFFVDTVTRESSNFSLVPVFVRRRARGERADYEGFFSGLLNLALATGLVLAVAVELLAPFVVGVLGPGLSAGARSHGAAMLRIAAPMLLFAPGITLQGVVLDSARRFNFSALRNAVAPGTVAVVLGLTWTLKDPTVWIVGAYSLGFLLYFVIMHLAVRSSGHRHVWRAWPSAEDLRDVRGAVGWPTLGFVVRQGSHFVERMLASLVAPGGVSAYYFAFRLYSACQTLIGSSVATTGLPALSSLNADGKTGRMLARLRSRVKVTLALVVPAAAVILLFHDPIVTLLYRRGAFDASAVERTGSLLFWLGWGVIFGSLVSVLQSALYALEDYLGVFRNMATMAVLDVLLAVGLSHLLGLRGIALAVSITAAASVSNVLYLLGRRGITPRRLWSAS